MVLKNIASTLNWRVAFFRSLLRIHLKPWRKGGECKKYGTIQIGLPIHPSFKAALRKFGKRETSQSAKTSAQSMTTGVIHTNYGMHTGNKLNMNGRYTQNIPVAYQ